MTQYQPQYPPYPGAPTPAGPTTPESSQRRRFPFVAGYVLWFMPALWRDAARRWGGVGFFYMLILLAITWAIVFAKGYSSLKDFVRNDVPTIATQIPNIDIKDGVVTTDAEEPHVITNPENGEPLIVIDTTGETTEPPEDEPSMLLTRDELIIRQQNKVETRDLKGVNFHIDGKRVQGWADWLLASYWPLAFPIVVALWMLLRFGLMLVYGVIGLLVGSGVRPPVGYAASMRLAALAMTPIILINSVLWATNISPGCGWVFLGIGLEITLLVFMVRSNNDPTAEVSGGGAGYGYGPPGGGYAPPGYAPQPMSQGYLPPPPPAPSAPPAYNPRPPGPPPSQPGY